VSFFKSHQAQCNPLSLQMSQIRSVKEGRQRATAGRRSERGRRGSEGSEGFARGGKRSDSQSKLWWSNTSRCMLAMAAKCRSPHSSIGGIFYFMCSLNIPSRNILIGDVNQCTVSALFLGQTSLRSTVTKSEAY